jgi:YfiH family protein
MFSFVELLTASSINVPHGFPTRHGGISIGAFSSLNTSFVVGDDEAHVRENLKRLASAAKVEPDKLFSVTQVHGDVVVHGPDSTPQTQADAVWTQTVGTAVGVRTADCLPVLLHDPRSGRVAAAHAGWRGVINELTLKTISFWQEHGTRPEELRAAIGPCIQKCCFEVDGDLPERFSRLFGAEVVVSVEGKEKKHLDLPRAVFVTLQMAGVPTENIEVLPQCTHCDARFFSHRRDQGVTGRHLSFITCVGASRL